MIDQKKRTYHFETSSLLPLKLVLIEAEKESHLRASQEQKDVNEELALKLIANMKKKYRKAMSLRGALVATKQSPSRMGIASGLVSTACVSITNPRNDIELEP
jgi:hypothetical protein